MVLIGLMDPVGLPTRRRSREAARESIDRLTEVVDDILEKTGMSEDELFEALVPDGIWD